MSILLFIILSQLTGSQFDELLEVQKQQLYVQQRQAWDEDSARQEVADEYQRQRYDEYRERAARDDRAFEREQNYRAGQNRERRREKHNAGN